MESEAPEQTGARSDAAQAIVRNCHIAVLQLPHRHVHPCHIGMCTRATSGPLSTYSLSYSPLTLSNILVGDGRRWRPASRTVRPGASALLLGGECTYDPPTIAYALHPSRSSRSSAHQTSGGTNFRRPTGGRFRPRRSSRESKLSKTLRARKLWEKLNGEIY